MSSSSRFKDLVARLSPLSSERLYEPGLPQWRAAMWLSDKGGIPNAATGGRGLDLTVPGLAQRYALAVFYYATGGPEWKDGAGWLGERGKCQWEGITCTPPASNAGEEDAAGFVRVSRIEIAGLEQSGGDVSRHLGKQFHAWDGLPRWELTLDC